MNAKGLFVETLAQMEKKPKTPKTPQSHMKASMKIEIYMLLIQEFSLNEWAELKYVIYLKQNSWKLSLTNTIHRKPADQRFGSQEIQITFMSWKVEFYLIVFILFEDFCTVNSVTSLDWKNRKQWSIMMKIDWSKADHSVFTNGIVFPLSLRLPVSVFTNKTNRKKETVK